MGIVYALASLAFASVADLLFKLYLEGKQRSVGPFIAVNGLAWSLAFAGPALAHWQLGGKEWVVTLGAGACSVGGNFLLLEAMRSLPVGVCATGYRLNLALVVVLALVWLHEPLTGLKALGVALAVAAILLLYQPEEGKTGRRRRKLAYLMLITASGCKALMGLLYKVAMLQAVPKADFLFVGGVCWLVGGLVYAAVKRERFDFSRDVWGFGTASGLAIVGIVYFLVKATAVGEASIVVPISQLSFMLTVLMAYFFLKEPLTGRKLAAVGLASGCVIALAMV